jgi:hypothetical protein
MGKPDKVHDDSRHANAIADSTLPTIGILACPPRHPTYPTE